MQCQPVHPRRGHASGQRARGEGRLDFQLHGGPPADAAGLGHSGGERAQSRRRRRLPPRFARRGQFGDHQHDTGGDARRLYHLQTRPFHHDGSAGAGGDRSGGLDAVAAGFGGLLPERQGQLRPQGRRVRDPLRLAMVSRILLINANRCSAPDPVFPLGLSHLNAALRRAGHETRLFALLAEPQPVEEVLRDYRPDFTGISLRNVDNVLIRQQEAYFASLLTLSDAVRRAHPCTVVIGGSGFSIYPRKLFELSGADFGIQGEGEASLVALVAARRGGGDYASIPGLVYRRGRQIVANPQQASGAQTGLEAADRPPAVADFYLTASGMLNVQTQRGCEHACTYCAYPLIEGCLHPRRDPEAVATEFEQLQAIGAKYAFVVDSVFN